jgi:regulator of extracellular matrix RemA (YlzA/DUF370 family)
MAEQNTTNYKAVIETDVTPSIAELKKLQKELKTTTDPARFKELQQQIDDTKDAIAAARTGAGNFAEVLGTLPGPIGDIAARAGGLIGTLKTFGQVKLGDLQGSFVELGKDLKDVAKGFFDLTGITKVYTVLNQALARSFVAVGVGEQAAAVGARTFAAALTATGIGALVVGLGLLIANWDKVTDAITGATDESKTYEEAQTEVTKSVSDFNKKLTDVTNTLKAAKAGTISKEDALKKYNDTLGSTVGYAGSLEQAESLLAENTAVVVEGIKLRTQANVFYAKSAEAAAKAVSGEDVDPSIWESVGNYILSGGNALVFQMNQIKTVSKNYTELGVTADKFSKEGDKLTNAAIENDKKLKKGLAKPPDTTKAADQRKAELEAIKKNSEAALLAVMEAQDKEVATVKKKYEEEIKLAEKYGKSTTELVAAREKELKDIRDKFAKETAEKAKEAAEKLKEIEDKKREERILAIENEIQLDEQKYTKLIALVNDREKVLVSTARQAKEQALKDTTITEEERATIIKNADRVIIDAQKTASAERLTIQNQRYDEQIANINAKEKELLTNTELNEAQRKQIQIQAADERKAVRQSEVDDALLTLDTEYNLIGTSYDRKQQLINEKEALLLQDTTLTEAQRTAIQQQASNERQNIAMAELEAKAALQTAELDLVQQGAGFLKEIAGKNKKLQIAAVIVEQAAAIGKIAVNTGIANAKAIAASPLTFGQPWVTINTISGVLSAATAVAAGVKAIQQINSADSGTPASAPSLNTPRGGQAITAPTVAAATAPTIQTGGNQNPTQQIADTIGAASGKPIKTYVLAQDVSSKQAFDRRTNNAASF